uniref:Uncharacterized protein n=1 Tax=viral metagenome TaxID=1070528 RepID=A0A6C0CH08_9ZZZZ
MADISKLPIRNIHKLKVGVEYEGRGDNVPLIRGTFKKLITDHGDTLAVFDPMFMGRDEYHLQKTEHPEDWARLDGVYDYFPLRVEATKKFERNLKELPQYREKREAVRGLRDSVLPPDITDKIAEMATGVRRKPVMKKKNTGGRRFTRKQCKTFKCSKMGFTQKASCRPYKNCYRSSAGGVSKKRRTHKRRGRYEGPYINPTYNTLPFKW